MNALKHFFQAVLYRLKQLCSLPQTMANASKARAQQTVIDEQEAERLDRIRNPSKYRCK